MKPEDCVGAGAQDIATRLPRLRSSGTTQKLGSHVTFPCLIRKGLDKGSIFRCHYSCNSKFHISKAHL